MRSLRVCFVEYSDLASASRAFSTMKPALASLNVFDVFAL